MSDSQPNDQIDDKRLWRGVSRRTSRSSTVLLVCIIIICIMSVVLAGLFEADELANSGGVFGLCLTFYLIFTGSSVSNDNIKTDELIREIQNKAGGPTIASLQEQIQVIRNSFYSENAVNRSYNNKMAVGSVVATVTATYGGPMSGFIPSIWVLL